MNAFLLFESLRPAGNEQKSFQIQDPEEVLQCFSLEEVGPLLQKVESRARDGCLAAGFVTYEAGFAFLPAMPEAEPPPLPLVWFAVTRRPRFVKCGEFEGASDRSDVKGLALSKSPEQYGEAIERIKRHIERGDTYQVNYTMRYRGTHEGSPLSLYQRLRSRQRVNYAAFIQTDAWAVISLSPELFFRRSGRTVIMRPMKGTAARGRTLREDEAQARSLRESPKETSENLMIVDLLRNDLGKICEPGSIRVSSPMQVEKYETLLQMTSTIEGRLLDSCGTADLFEATFPSGSVTGAPKVRTMQIIHELESEPRGIYTGAVGYLTGSDSVFNVAIRTAFIDRMTGGLEMGVGSGILHEADTAREYNECVLKARFLEEAQRPFRLFETIRWTPQDGFVNLEMHLDRMLDSAAYFLFPVDRDSLRKALVVKSETPLRVRLLLDENGSIEVESEPLDPTPSPLRVCLANESTCSVDRFLFHKTTHRELYERELSRARSLGFFDVIFRNEKDEITEGAISNIVIRKGNDYLTPPVECGLLPGTLRRYLMEARPVPIQERVLTVADLLQADAVYLTNALRGMVQVELEVNHP